MRGSQAADQAVGSRRTASDYTAFLQFAAGKKVRRRVLEQFDEWLREKHIDADLSQNLVASFGDRELSLIHRRAHHGHDVSGRLLEPTDEGVWKTEVLLHVQDREPGWLRIRVTNDQGRFVAVPRLATYVMDVVDTFDGPAQYTSQPQVLRGMGAEELLELACDPERAAPIFAAGSDASLPFDTWVRKVGQWTKQVRGMAHVIVLDPPATRAFDEMVGESHSVRSGTIRTFLPEVDPAVVADGLRHRVLGVWRLTEQPDAATTNLFGRIARESASSRLLPASVAQVERAVRRVADDFLLDQLVDLAVPVVGVEEAPAGPSAPTTDEMLDAPVEHVAAALPTAIPDERADQVLLTQGQLADLQRQVDEYLATVRMVQDILGIEQLDEQQLQSLAALADQARVRVEALDQVRSVMAEKEAKADLLEDANRALDRRVQEVEFELAIVEEDKTQVANENRWLRSRLREAEDFEGAFGAVPDDAKTTYPESFDELLEWVDKPEFKARGVIFCGDADEARDLDDVDDWKRCVKAAWEGILMLQDYLRARREGVCNAGLDYYLEHTPSGYLAVPPKKFASTETGQTMKGHGEERKFPVPSRVKKSGFAVMKAHVKLAKVGMVSPRMYLLDQFTVDGHVYVGYIGRHLTNTQTN